MSTATSPAEQTANRNPVDWGVAVATAQRLVKPGPAVPMEEAERAVAQLRGATDHAETHVRELTGLGAGLPQKLAAGTLTEEDLRGMVTLEATKAQYLDGVSDPTLVSPDVWVHDQALLDRPGGAEIQLALLADYHHNIALYPKFHEYFRASQVPLLAVWGGNDAIFVADGARAYTRDLPDAEIHLLATGHFALETHLDAIAGYVHGFLGRVLK